MSRFIFGVRHHSPACTRAVLDAAAELHPSAVAVEFPSDLSAHLRWLGHPELVAPVAVATETSAKMSLYPFADFSPELAVIRWAMTNDVPVHAIDLPAGADRYAVPEREGAAGNSPARPDVSSIVGQDAWDARVETPSVGADWRAVRRAALAVGYTSRLADAGSLGAPAADELTLARERWMIRCLDELETGDRDAGPVLVVVGAFHAAALAESSEDSDTAPSPTMTDVVSSLVPYSFGQLDSRSGYPSGIRDPEWRQRMLQVSSANQVRPMVTALVTDVIRALRAQGHPAGPAEAAETVRLATGLADLRDLPAPGRTEVLEALTTVFAQGSVAGRGRTVASALHRVMVGQKIGALPSQAPEPVLLSHTRALAKELGMPTKERDRAREVRVDAFGSRTGLRRHLLLESLEVLGVPFRVWEADGGTGAAGSRTVLTRGLERRSYTATLAWRTKTTASLSLLGSRGTTVRQATDMVLMEKLRAAPEQEQDVDTVVAVLGDAARTGAEHPFQAALDALHPLMDSLGFSTAVTVTELLGAVQGLRLPAASLFAEATFHRCTTMVENVTGVILREIDGISGSDDLSDARLLGRTAAFAAEHPTEVTASLARLTDHGSALMSGAALAVRHQLAAESCDAEAPPPGARIASWLDLGARSSTRRTLERRLTGYLAASGGRWIGSDALTELIERIGTVDDALFVSALPALRGAFDTVPAVDREDFLNHLAAVLGERPGQGVDVPGARLESFAATDLEARNRLDALGLADVHFSPETRWRLVLGAEPDHLPPTATRLADTLDELYGGPGDNPTGAADGRVRRRVSGGHRQIGVRQWAGEITALFGEDHVQEILATAAERGRVDALLGPDGRGSLAPQAVRPSVNLLSTVLGLRGALSESQLVMLRPLVTQLVDELTKKLSTRIRPVLVGRAGTRTSRHRTGRLDLRATLRSNLRHVTEVDGRTVVVPEHPVFRAPERRTSPWHIILVVDVSPSMEASTVHAAVTAAILAGVSTFRLSFLAFDSEVIDLSEHTEDPLSLLLEMSPGGGTDIAGAVSYAAEMVTDPTRTAMVVVSDFDEGGSVTSLLAGVHRLVESGVRMLGCAALADDDGTDGKANGQAAGGVTYNVGVTRRLAAAGMRVAPVSPVELARWIGDVLG